MSGPAAPRPADPVPMPDDAIHDVHALTDLVRRLRDELAASQERCATLTVELERAQARAARALRREEEVEQRLALIETASVVQPSMPIGSAMAALQARLDAMHNSTSWRVTEPLRRVSAVVKRFRRAV